MTQRRHALISEQLREAIRSSGHSMLSVARDAKLDKATMSRFLSGQRGLRLDAIDRIGELLNLRLVSARKSTKRSKP